LSSTLIDERRASGGSAPNVMARAVNLGILIDMRRVVNP
jgi:hypothetical protein